MIAASTPWDAEPRSVRVAVCRYRYQVYYRALPYWYQVLYQVQVVSLYIPVHVHEQWVAQLGTNASSRSAHRPPRRGDAEPGVAD